MAANLSTRLRPTAPQRLRYNRPTSPAEFGMDAGRVAPSAQDYRAPLHKCISMDRDAAYKVLRPPMYSN